MRERDRTAYPEALEHAEAQLLERRRQSLPGYRPGHTESPLDDAVGVGLSGGGIRSATFCLGLFQAVAHHKLVRKIDFLSTVSGGGYFGSFLGRLFTREWVKDVDDVEHAIRGIDPPSVTENAESPHRGWADHAFRWLRENGRYLAPRGSGDLLTMGAILLRNWASVQIVMLTTVLSGFVLMQLFRDPLDRLITRAGAKPALDDLLSCTLPGGDSLFAWSPWIVLLVPALVVTVAAGWSYWLVVRRRDTEWWRAACPAATVVLAGLIGLIGIVRYRGAGPASLVRLLPPFGWAGTSVVAHTGRYWACAFLLLIAVLTILIRSIAQLAVRRMQLPDERDSGLRNALTTWTKYGLEASAVIVAWWLIDTAGASIYSAAYAGLRTWITSVAGLFAAVGAFARPALVLLAPRRGATRPPLSMSMISWAAAVAVLAVWLVGIDIGSHAIAWSFDAPKGAPTAATTSLPAGCLVTGPIPPRPATPVSIASCGILLLFTVLFGQTRTFANLSSLHTFYSARLTRTFLGASNPNRLGNASGVNATAVKDTVAGDDCSGDGYWRWPGGTESNARSAKPWIRGGPLHIINTTVNETMDAKMKVQNQDRKGTGLALGPCGLSLGIRHHLVTNEAGEPTAFPDKDGYQVFSRDGSSKAPESLTLGRWMSVSGAAFSAAAGANTTVPIALLAGMFNVRLGYWWDSGTSRPGWAPWLILERILPVQAALIAETLARTRGTSGRWWNLSDGGHFENMAGYELIRRRLPLIVIVDAEADPDYEFQGLSDLVRKARLDFDAEITFLSAEQLAGRFDRSTPVLPPEASPYFGDLAALRRGRWMDEAVPAADGGALKRYTLEVDRSRVSRAHAALARVDYHSPKASSWLVYVKATLMGDEPEDVCHYHRAHPEFPQESTNDQFFDEAQWESYRRLGRHIGHRVLTPELFAHLQGHPPPVH